MIDFAFPLRLWALAAIPVLVLLYLLLARRIARRRGSRNTLQMVVPRDRTWLRHVAVALALMSLVTLTLAWAKPTQDIEVPSERGTIVVTIDVSLSMEATDVEPNRLEAAKVAAIDFVQGIPPRYNVSVVTFAQTAAILVPPTTDHGAATAAIENLQLAPSTAIGEGIFTSLNALLQVPPDPENPDEPPPARIVLLSDGKTTYGRSAAVAAEQARVQEVPIYTIAYGTENGYVEIEGQREPVPVDRVELQNVADISGGEAYEAQSAEQLVQVYEDIQSSVGTERVPMEATSRYAGAGLFFAVLASLGLVSLAARWP
ncbi:Ca-activated chloride channel family protein [Auraticoccus monumenti]|uniref:Ca-activated chloride channel family protein n=1 Tax=Auraticoccus monumenti TaxID=675864 RepID=A0A1G7E986_9ACTN|nr:Ca-activated chloride channel family protein [Auraticoccus monumenti]